MAMINFPDMTNFPLLSTVRFDLVAFTEGNVSILHQFNSSLEMLWYIPRDVFKTVEQSRQKYEVMKSDYTLQKAIWWVIKRKSDELAVGYCGLFDMHSANAYAEIGYGILEPFWRQGIASEIIPCITAYGYKALNLHRIQANINPENAASRKVIEKQGFSLEGHLKDTDFARNKYFDRMVYACLNPDH